MTLNGPICRVTSPLKRVRNDRPYIILACTTKLLSKMNRNNPENSKSLLIEKIKKKLYILHIFLKLAV